MTDEPLRYEVIVYWSADTGAPRTRHSSRRSLSLPGCAADGSSSHDALTNVEVVALEWIETARELGRPILEPKGRLLFA
jgi:hypothetical protein